MPFQIADMPMLPSLLTKVQFPGAEPLCIDLCHVSLICTWKLGREGCAASVKTGGLGFRKSKGLGEGGSGKLKGGVVRSSWVLLCGLLPVCGFRIFCLSPVSSDESPQVSVQSKSDEQGRQQREERTKALKNQAKDYLSTHNIEERLSEAVKALLKAQPSDPTEFLCRTLREGAPPVEEKSKAPAKTPEVSVAQAPQAKDKSAPVDSGKAEVQPEPDAQAVREKAQEALSKADNDGSLDAAPRDISKGKEVEVDTLELRKRTGDLLSNASKNGDLEQALREVQAGKESKQNLKEKASKTLLQASENGELDRVLKEVKSERIDVLHE
ncbi:unnamed protein product, partial [Polarella glacialis]